MSYLNQTNFSPNENWAGYVAPALTCRFGNCYGNGVPTDGEGFDGNTYIDLDSGTFYVTYNGVWAVQGSGGGGAGLTYTQGASLDPNGSVSGGIGDVFHSKVSLGGDGSTWWKTTAGGNLGWE